MDEIDGIIEGYRNAAEKAVTAGVDILEIQGGHGYLLSQFLNGKINQRTDAYGKNRLLFAEKVLSAVRKGAPELPCILRISGSEMSPEFGISQDDLLPLLRLAEEAGISAVHVGMGSACFSPALVFSPRQLTGKTPMGCACLGTRSDETSPDSCRSHGTAQADQTDAPERSCRSHCSGKTADF